MKVSHSGLVKGGALLEGLSCYVCDLECFTFPLVILISLSPSPLRPSLPVSLSLSPSPLTSLPPLLSSYSESGSCFNFKPFHHVVSALNSANSVLNPLKTVNQINFSYFKFSNLSPLNCWLFWYRYMKNSRWRRGVGTITEMQPHKLNNKNDKLLQYFYTWAHEF